MLNKCLRRKVSKLRPCIKLNTSVFFQRIKIKILTSVNEKRSGKCLTLYTFAHVLFSFLLCQLLCMIILQFLTRRTSYLNMVSFFNFFPKLFVGKVCTPLHHDFYHLIQLSSHYFSLTSPCFFSCFNIMQCCKNFPYLTFLSSFLHAFDFFYPHPYSASDFTQVY